MAPEAARPTNHPLGDVFGELLRVYRIEAGLSQEDLAEKAGLSRRGISDLERGVRRAPYLATVRRLVLALQLDRPREVALTRAARGLPTDPTRDISSPAPSPMGAERRFRTLQNNLPRQRNRLIGRDTELRQIRQLLLRDDVNLVTITGAGGSGKTRLALELAHQLLEEFEDGVFFVPLAPVSEHARVLPTIAHGLGLLDVGNRPLLEIVKSALGEKRVLLLIDNFEHLRATAVSIADILSSCGQIRMLITSRAPLGVREEHEFPLSPLALVDSMRPQHVGVLADCPSVVLFVERAAAIQPELELSEDNIRAMFEVCRRVDGLPLGIELAAARIRVLSPQAMVARLSSRLPFLSSDALDRPPRHQTLRATISWSYDLLPETDQNLFCRLAIFPGGFGFDAAESVRKRPWDHERDMLDNLSSLVEQNLLIRDADLFGEPRFRMLETIREFGLDRLEMSADLESVRGCMAGWVLSICNAAGPSLRTAEQLPWLARLEREHDNIRAVLGWTRDGLLDASIGLRICAMIWWFWHHHSYLTEARRWLEGMLAAAGSDSGADTREVLIAVGVMAFNQSDDSAAAGYLERALALGRQYGDQSTIAQARLYQSVLAVSREHDLDRSSTFLVEAERIFDETRDIWGIAMVRSRQAVVARLRGAHADSRQLGEEAIRLFRETGDRFGLGHSLVGLGHNLLEIHQPEAAAKQFIAAVEPLREIGNEWFVSRALAGLASSAIALGRPEVAGNLLGCADELRERIGAPVYGPDRAYYERALESLSKSLQLAKFESAIREGHEAAPEDLIRWFRSSIAT